MEDRNYSDEVAYAIDQEVRRIVEGCYERVRAILKENQDVHVRIAKTLLAESSKATGSMPCSKRAFAMPTGGTTMVVPMNRRGSGKEEGPSPERRAPSRKGGLFAR